MSRVVLNNQIDNVRQVWGGKTRTAIYRAGQAVLKGAGNRTPRKTGQLRRQTSVVQVGPKSVQVRWSARYAAVQNQGLRAGARPFRKYTTGGTGPGFVQVGVRAVQGRAREFYS